MRTHLLISALVIVANLCQMEAVRGQVKERTADVPEKTDALDAMRARAAGVVVTVRESSKATPQPLQAAPRFRYSDPRRDILDAALWAYGAEGRPAALMKTEFYEVNGRQHWVYCITTLSDKLIEARWKDGTAFDSREPGVTLRSIPNAPMPGGSAASRLLQLKRLTARFSARIENGADNFDQMRLMPTPICRYENAQAGLIDGAVFGYTMGTNPDVLLVIELHRTDDGRHEWRCGAAGMTSAGFVVRMDATDIMNQPFDPANAGRPQAYARWMWHRDDTPAAGSGKSADK